MYLNINIPTDEHLSSPVYVLAYLMSSAMSLLCLTGLIVELHRSLGRLPWDPWYVDGRPMRKTVPDRNSMGGFICHSKNSACPLTLTELSQLPFGSSCMSVMYT